MPSAQTNWKFSVAPWGDWGGTHVLSLRRAFRRQRWKLKEGIASNFLEAHFVVEYQQVEFALEMPPPLGLGGAACYFVVIFDPRLSVFLFCWNGF